MTLFGLDEATVRSRIDGVRECADENLSEAFARAAWSGIVEPGDATAGLLVESLGAAPALSAILEGWSSARLRDAVRDAGGDVEPLEAIDPALERWRPRLASRDILLQLRQAERAGVSLLLPGDPLWPEHVGDLGVCAPLVLWWRGIPEALAALPRSIALVGARAASGYGKHVAVEAAAGLVDRGFAIVSGAAYGIDGTAHQSALASRGLTVAFLAGGADRFYPSGHDALLGRIAEVGAVVAELPCGSTPNKWRFLQRNRLIAATSAATVVLEAGWRSGSINTAGHAASIGRPLGAVPGPVTSPSSAGCHRLFREYDAVCVTDAAEMAELAGYEVTVPDASFDRAFPDRGGARPGDREAQMNSDHVRVLDGLSPRSPRTVLDIARRAGLSTSTVIGVLGALDLERLVVERETGWVRARA